MDILQDAGESAKDLHRPALTDLLNRINTGQVACVIVAKLDRLTRSTKDLADLLSTFREKHVDFISTAESFDTSTATGRMVLNMIGVIAQWEREIISERTSAALQEKRAQGMATGGVAPYGYNFINGERVENEREQAILTEIAAMKAAGESWQGIANRLTAKGHRTRGGGDFSRQGIFRIAKKHGLN